MSNSILLNKAKSFAVKIVPLCQKIKDSKKDIVLSNQLLKSGTSIGANIYESKYAQSTADFISKMQIALKECYETEYWLDLLFETGFISSEEHKPLHSDCGAIRRMLISSINTTKEKLS